MVKCVGWWPAAVLLGMYFSALKEQSFHLGLMCICSTPIFPSCILPPNIASPLWGKDNWSCFTLKWSEALACPFLCSIFPQPGVIALCPWCLHWLSPSLNMSKCWNNFPGFLVINTSKCIMKARSSTFPFQQMLRFLKYPFPHTLLSSKPLQLFCSHCVKTGASLFFLAWQDEGVGWVRRRVCVPESEQVWIGPAGHSCAHLSIVSIWYSPLIVILQATFTNTKKLGSKQMHGYLKGKALFLIFLNS